MKVFERSGKMNGKQTHVVGAEKIVVVTRYHKIPGRVSSLYQARFDKGTFGYKIAREWVEK